MNLKQLKNQNGFIDVTKYTSRRKVFQGIYHQIYPTNIWFETLIPFKTVIESTQK
ncbi:hypothetical protein [Mesoplasma corruscae]|uniref:Uncharacterized protein n=1 Tax=Mesoplasma corruscae TaxID=216874 RepID=A0A2S5REE2_9MOLU|nr:hypothetical protein [Mesoplasma corruscae]PPE05658.1 hypothetical protein MCORR_v1c06860 [Mesoplasma corruscae]